MSNLKSYDALSIMADALRSWAAQHDAKIVVAENPAHAIDIISGVKPGKPTVVIFYASDTLAGGALGVLDTALDATVRLGVIQHPGLGIKGGAPSAVLRTVDSLRAYMANLAMVDYLDHRPHYSGMTYIATEAGRLLNGYALTYTMHYAYEI